MCEQPRVGPCWTIRHEQNKLYFNEREFSGGDLHIFVSFLIALFPRSVLHEHAQLRSSKLQNLMNINTKLFHWGNFGENIQLWGAGNDSILGERVFPRWKAYEMGCQKDYQVSAYEFSIEMSCHLIETAKGEMLFTRCQIHTRCRPLSSQERR